MKFKMVLGSISAIASEKNIFLYFPIWSCVNTMTCGGSHLGFPIGIKNIYFVEDLPMIIPVQFGFNCPSGFREEDFLEINQSETIIAFGGHVC
jgi:hypothetical protein